MRSLVVIPKCFTPETWRLLHEFAAALAKVGDAPRLDLSSSDLEMPDRASLEMKMLEADRRDRQM